MSLYRLLHTGFLASFAIGGMALSKVGASDIVFSEDFESGNLDQ
jgi:hypothetical protein